MCLLIVRLDLILFTTRFQSFSVTIDYHFNLGGVITSLVLGVMQKGKRHVKYDWAITPSVMLKINKSDFFSNVKHAVFAFAVSWFHLKYVAWKCSSQKKKKKTPLVLRIKRFHLDNSYFCNVTCF